MVSQDSQGLHGVGQGQVQQDMQEQPWQQRLGLQELGPYLCLLDLHALPHCLAYAFFTPYAEPVVRCTPLTFVLCCLALQAAQAAMAAPAGGMAVQQPLAVAALPLAMPVADADAPPPPSAQPPSTSTKSKRLLLLPLRTVLACSEDTHCMPTALYVTLHSPLA